MYLECIDSFDEIFEINKDLIQELELTDILDPYLFDNHRDIINALFEVYYDIGENYLNKFYDEKQVNKIKDEARDKVEKQYGSAPHYRNRDRRITQQPHCVRKTTRLRFRKSIAIVQS